MSFAKRKLDQCQVLLRMFRTEGHFVSAIPNEVKESFLNIHTKLRSTPFVGSREEALAELLKIISQYTTWLDWDAQNGRVTVSKKTHAKMREVLPEKQTSSGRSQAQVMSYERFSEMFNFLVRMISRYTFVPVSFDPGESIGPPGRPGDRRGRGRPYGLS